MGIVGGALFSGAGVFASMSIYQKRKKNKKNEQQVDIQGEGLESNKEIVNTG